MEYLVYLPPFFSVGVGQDALYHIGGHFLYNIDGIVQKQVVDDIFKLSVRKGLNKRLLQIRIHLNEHVCCKILMQKTVHERKLILGKLFEQLRNIGGSLGAQKLAQLLILFFIKQSSDLCDHHGTLLSVSVYRKSTSPGKRGQRYYSGVAARAANFMPSRASFMEGAPYALLPATNMFAPAAAQMRAVAALIPPSTSMLRVSRPM